jgi:ABC-2 type transport system permease protein
MIIYWLYRRWRARRDAQRAPRPQAVAPGNLATAAAPSRNPRAGGALGMVLHQARYDLVSFVRNSQARFFTVLLPLLFLVIFVSVFGNDRIGPTHIKASTYYVPGIAALAVIAGSFVNLVIAVTTEREMGILKRRRATPVPAWVLIAGRTLTAMAVSLGVMAVLLAVGSVFYGVQLPSSTIPAVVITAVLGSAAFCVLGWAFSTMIGSADAAQPMVQAVMLPLYFISGVFIPNISLPTWLRDVARVFPVQHLADGLHNALDPTVRGSGLVAADLGVLALWALLGVMVGLRRFSWLPAGARA